MSRLKDELAHQLERLVDHLRGANEPATCCHCGEPNIEFAVRQDGEHPADSEVYCAAALDDGNWGPGLLKARIAGPGEHLTWREFNCRLLATTNEWEPIGPALIMPHTTTQIARALAGAGIEVNGWLTPIRETDTGYSVDVRLALPHKGGAA